MDNKKKTKLQIGLWLDTSDIPSWIYLIIKNIIDSPHFELSLILLNSNPQKLQYKRIFTFIVKLEKKFVKLKHNALQTFALESIDAKIPVLNIIPFYNEEVFEINAQYLEKIRVYNLDVLLNFCAGRPTGEILNLPLLGSWSLDFLQKNLITGLPAGFMEILNLQKTTQISINCFTPRNNHFYTYKNHIQTYPFSFSKSRNRLLWKSTALVNQFLNKLYINGVESFLNTSNENKNEIINNKFENRYIIAKFLRYLYLLLVHGLYKSLYYEQWILLVKKSKEIDFYLPSFIKILPPKDRFWADPHIIYKNNKYYVFIEELIFSKKNAHISVLTIDDNLNISSPVKLFEKDCHLSYPFIFEWQNNIYMIPETSGNRTIELYICIEFPYKWKFHKYLLKDITAGDVTLFFHDEKWWLFTNIALNDGYPNWDDLYLYYSDNPLGDEWTAHPNNPVVSDVSSSRPAGKIFVQNNNIFRPSQDSSERYGFAINISQIITINEKEYVEKKVNKIVPGWDKNINRVHTINHEHQLTIVDAKRKVFKFLTGQKVEGINNTSSF